MHAERCESTTNVKLKNLECDNCREISNYK